MRQAPPTNSQAPTIDHGFTLLERAMRVLGDSRKALGPIRISPVQAGILLFLSRHPTVIISDLVSAFSVRLPTICEKVRSLESKRWVRKTRSRTDERAVYLSLTKQGQSLIPKIEKRIRQVEEPWSTVDRRAVGKKSPANHTNTLAPSSPRS